MLQVIVSYDLGTAGILPHAEVISQASARGWGQWIPINTGRTFKLPNTTLVGIFSDMNAAESSFAAAIDAASVQLKSKVIVTKQVLIAVNSTRSASDEVR